MVRILSWPFVVTGAAGDVGLALIRLVLSRSLWMLVARRDEAFECLLNQEDIPVLDADLFQILTHTFSPATDIPFLKIRVFPCLL